MQYVILVCGVSGSGKTWVCEQLKDKFHYVPHDLHYKNHAQVMFEEGKKTQKPQITECPFGERVFRHDLIYKYNFTVLPYFVITPPDVVAKQYLEREGKPLPKAAYTRATSILDRAKDWKAPYGSSIEILEKLQKLELG